MEHGMGFICFFFVALLHTSINIIGATATGTDNFRTLATDIQVESITFPGTVKPPSSSEVMFLGGAGVRGLDINGTFVKFTAIGVYLENDALLHLAPEWKGKSADELLKSVKFFRDIVTGPFEKFIRVTMILPLTGKQYSEKVAENCVAYWKSVGSYTKEEERAVKKFLMAFKNEDFQPGASILFTQSPNGSLGIGFIENGKTKEKAVIKNKQLSEAVLESIIGEQGVSPATKKSLASRISEFLKAEQTGEENGKADQNPSATTDSWTHYFRFF